MASSAPSAMPSGVTAPLKTISDTDMGGLIAILAGFSLALVIISLPIRAYVRSKIGTYKTDDYMFCVAAVAAIFQAGCVFYGVREGLGKSLEQVHVNEVPSMEKAVYISDLFYIFALFLSKCSTAFLLLRLTPGRGHFYALWGTICLSTTWLIISLVLLGLRCHTKEPWMDVFSVSQCANIFPRWQFVTALDVVTEFALFAISVYLVWGIQMSMRSKTIVVAAFGCRLPVVALALLRLHFLEISLFSTNPTLLVANAICATQLEIGYSILSSIIPCLKSFIAPYDPATGNTAYKSAPSTNLKLSSLATASSNLKSTTATTINDDNDDTLIEEGRAKAFMGRLRPEQTVYEAKIVTRERRSGSTDSQRMIIKKGVEWSVDYDSARLRTPERGSEEHLPSPPPKSRRRSSGISYNT